MIDCRRVLAALVLTLLAGQVAAQRGDSVPPVRHILAIDYSRIKPFRRSFDAVVVSADSVTHIGRRDVSLEEIMVAGSSAGWVLVETRSGTMGAIDSLFLAVDLRPVRWHSTMNGASLEMAFTADSMQGTIRVGQAASRFSAAVPPDIIVSTAAFEMLAQLLPLTESWADSASALSVTAAAASVEPSAMVVAGVDSVVVTPGTPSRPAWVVSLHSGARESQVWVDRESGDILKTQQLLPSRVGAVLEYRMRLHFTTAP